VKALTRREEEREMEEDEGRGKEKRAGEETVAF